MVLCNMLEGQSAGKSQCKGRRVKIRGQGYGQNFKWGSQVSPQGIKALEISLEENEGWAVWIPGQKEQQKQMP